MIVYYFFIFQVITQSFLTSNRKRDCISCSTGKFLFLILIFGVAYLVLTHDTIPSRVVSRDQVFGIRKNEDNNSSTNGAGRLKKFWRRAPRLPPQLPPDTKVGNNGINHVPATLDGKSLWITRQQKVKEAFTHAWSGYKKYAMGYDELMPVSQRGIDGLGGLGATVVDALDTAMIMGIDEVVAEAGSWVEQHLSERIGQKGQVNLFETTIRVLGGLLSAYHLSGGEKGVNTTHAGPNPSVYLETAKNLGDRLLSAFTSSPTPIPFSDVVLHDSSAHPAPGGLSSTSEVSTLQLEFNYLSSVSGDPKYGLEAMKVMEHIKSLPKVEGLVPIYIRYGIRYILITVSGHQFSFEIIIDK
jgi:mannosyl-oligosaccharide alpha-1,2-mannosidase